MFNVQTEREGPLPYPAPKVLCWPVSQLPYQFPVLLYTLFDRLLASHSIGHFLRNYIRISNVAPLLLRTSSPGLPCCWARLLALAMTGEDRERERDRDLVRRHEHDSSSNTITSHVHEIAGLRLQ